jgi:nitrite reductase/ring-hydroxylating ferredoxin subunit
VKTKVLDVAALPLLTPTLVTVDGEDVVLYRRGSEIFALGNECPHQGGNLCDGWIEGDILSCPLHGWEFDLRTGVCMTISRRARGPLRGERGSRAPSTSSARSEGTAWPT